MSPWTDRCEDELIRRVRARRPGWEVALSALLGIHREALYRRCHYLLGNTQDAEDALQETLLRGARGIDGFEGRAGLRTWLTAIANNQCYTEKAIVGKDYTGSRRIFARLQGASPSA